jgi:hypothetical protein
MNEIGELFWAKNYISANVSHMEFKSISDGDEFYNAYSNSLLALVFAKMM